MAIGRENGDWYGPWCIFHALVVENQATITDELHEFRRHVYEDGVFRTEKIDIEKWWKLGYKYRQLPGGSLSK